MGKLLILFKFVFFVFSSDFNESRRHVHVTDKKRDKERVCKFWIEPKIELHENIGFSSKELNEIEKLLGLHLELLNGQLDLFYSGKRVKPIMKDE